MTPEHRRLEEDAARTRHWKRWGPYLSERAWGTVREDYSADGDGLGLLPARPRPLARLPLERGRPRRHLRPPPAHLLRAGALERARPDPQGAAVRPHRQRGQSRRGRQGVLLLPRHARRPTPTCRCSTSTRRRRSPTRSWSTRTAAAAAASPSSSWSTPASSTSDRYFDVFVEYAKADADDILIRDHGRQPRAGGRAAPRAADALVPQHLVVGRRRRGPALRAASPRRRRGDRRSSTSRATAGAGSTATAPPELLFTENETNTARLFGTPNATATSRTASTTASSTAARDAVNPARRGTKAAAHYRRDRARGRTRRRPAAADRPRARRPGRRRRSAPTSTASFARRQREADEFYADGDSRRARRPTRERVMRQALAGLLWSKQFYHYVVARLARRAIPAQPPPPAERAARPQQRVAAPLQRRRHLDAGQVGVPVVRRLGSGVPLRAARAGRPRVRQGAARAAAARVVHAPERPAAGLRVGVRRRQPAGARLGGVARLQDREEAHAASATACSSSASSRSCCSTSPGG